MWPTSSGPPTGTVIALARDGEFGFSGSPSMRSHYQLASLFSQLGPYGGFARLKY
jgi:hypothetical protein